VLQNDALPCICWHTHCAKIVPACLGHLRLHADAALSGFYIKCVAQIAQLLLAAALSASNSSTQSLYTPA
jgi:hypothetical protein